MCGIIAYKGEGAKENVLQGLKSLEYRGYDSWGITALNNNQLSTIKKVGKIGEISPKDLSLPDTNIAIGHTRWATHGEVNEINSHPHFSNNNKIAVVHNGIIENYQELKKFLEEDGYSFKSRTDTEVIPNLIQYFIEQGQDSKQAFTSTLDKLKGCFAIVMLNQDSNDISIARRGSPLVLGIRDNEFFVASDVPAFLNHTNKVVYLEDNDYGFINSDLELFSLESKEKVNREIKEVNWSPEQAQKGDYPHFMLKEMTEQKETIAKAINQDPALIKESIEMINNAQGVFFVGCGSSYHACISASYQFAHVAKKHVNVVLASEFRNYENFLTDKTLMIAVSQSGETADLLDAIKVAKSHGVKVISIVNTMGSSLTRISDKNIMMNAGPEICVLSTKSYTSQLAILTLLAYGSADKLEQGKELVKKASSFVEDIITTSQETLKPLANKLKDQKDFFLIGRDLAFPSALEGALKIKEVSYIHAEGFAGAELKHGTIALIEKNTPTIVLTTPETKEAILSNAEEIKARGGYIIGIGEENNELYDFHIKVPDVGNANPLLMIIPIQVLSYYLALERGCDPDKPRNLAKSVTVK